MTLEQYNKASDIICKIYRFKSVLRRCESMISDGQDKIYIMGDELPPDISKHLTERALEMLNEKISALEKEFNEL